MARTLETGDAYERLIVWLDTVQPVPAEHTDPAWPNGRGSHCDVCRARARAGFLFGYSHSDVPGRTEQYATEALTGTGRFSVRGTEPAFRFQQQ